MKTKCDLIEKRMELEKTFDQDPEVIKLVSALKNKFYEQFNTIFTDSDVASEEFQSVCDDYYNALREDDPDDVTIFQALWFTSGI